MEIITLLILSVVFFCIYSWGEYNGIRKGDEVIVHLEYEDRSGTKEF